MTRNRKRQYFHRSIAWGFLLVVFSSMMLKAVHHHTYERGMATPAITSQARTIVSSYDDCPVCHFIFSPFEDAKVIQPFFIAVFLGLQYCIFLYRKFQSQVLFHYLRAPPVVVLKY